MYNVNEKRKLGVNLLLSAGLAGAIFIVFCIFAGVQPFGESSILRNDALQQYAPFLSDFIQSIKSGEAISYSWHLGAGTNGFALMCYYLLSPFNLLALPFDNTNIEIAFLLIILAKLMCVAATTTIFLSKKFNCNGLLVSAFSLLYSFSGFFVAYYYNTMWLDALIMLPLIALGIENIINGKKSTLYFIALTYSILVNFYMAYMLCIFAVMYFLLQVFSQNVTNSKDKTAIDNSKAKEPSIMPVLAKFGVSSLFAGLVSAVVIIPVLYAISNCASKNDFETSGLLFNVMDFFSYHLSGVDVGVLELTNATGPYVMSGILTLILVPMFFSIKSIKLNEKISTAVVLIIMFLSFQIPQINFFWHGMNQPAGMPYRFSYIYTFLLVVVAFKTFLKLKEIPTWAFAIPGVIIIATLIYSPFSEFSSHFTTLTYVLSAVAAVLYFAQLLLLKKGYADKKMASLLLCICVIAELGIGNYKNLRAIDNVYTEYYPNINSVDEVKTYLEENIDTQFYRMELSKDSGIATLPSMYGYNGISNFSSLTDTSFAITQYNLGNFGNLSNSYEYTNQTPVYNALFAIDYIYDTQGIISNDNPFYEKVEDVSGKGLYKVKYSLPLGYCVNSEIDSWDPYNVNANSIQYQLFNKTTGVGQVYSFISENKITYINCNAVDFNEVSDYIVSNKTQTEEETEHVHDDNCDHEHEDEVVDPNSNVTDFGELNETTLGNMLDSMGGLYPFKATADNFAIEFEFTAEKDGEIFVLPASGCLNTMSIVNSDGSSRKFDVSNREMCDIGYYNAGETFKLTVSEPDRPLSEFDDEFPLTDSVQLSVVTVDEEKFVQGYNEILKNGVLEIEDIDNTHISGKVNSSKDCVMMMAMPYDEGWTLYVDGVETSITEHRSHIMMFNISQGEHNIELKYFPQGLKEGMFVSIASVLCLVLIGLLKKVRQAKSELLAEENEQATLLQHDSQTDENSNKE